MDAGGRLVELVDGESISTRSASVVGNAFVVGKDLAQGPEVQSSRKPGVVGGQLLWRIAMAMQIGMDCMLFSNRHDLELMSWFRIVDLGFFIGFLR